jgi:hypothetical protein
MSSFAAIDNLIRRRTVDGPSLRGIAGICNAVMLSTSVVNTDMPSAQMDKLRTRLGGWIMGKMEEVSALFMNPERELVGNAYGPAPTISSGSSLTGLLIRLQGGDEGGVLCATAIVLEAPG